MTIEKTIRNVLVKTGRIVPVTDDEIEMVEERMEAKNIRLPKRLELPPTGSSELYMDES